MALYKLLRASLSGGPYDIRLRRNRLIVRNASTGKEFNDEPLLALSDAPRPKILAVGAASRGIGTRCINPFVHPRIVLADFPAAQALLRYAFHAVSPHRWIPPSPIAVFHVLESLEGGLSVNPMPGIDGTHGGCRST